MLQWIKHFQIHNINTNIFFYLNGFYLKIILILMLKEYMNELICFHRKTVYRGVNIILHFPTTRLLWSRLASRCASKVVK